MGAQRAGAPVLTGSVPPLAPFYHARQETGFGLADGLRPGKTILLVPAILGTGGTGKTQLAVGFTHAMWATRAVDLLVWVPAGNRSAIIAGYARAAADLELLADEEATADGAAQRFLALLRTTERRWAVVLDGVASPVDVDGLWPRGPSGQVIVTSRLRESELAEAGTHVSAHAVPGFSRREALAYLNTRITGYPDQRIEALDLAEDLNGLPIALAQAAAVVSVTMSTCREYRAEYAKRLGTTEGTVVDGCPQSLLATWSLAVEHAHKLGPAGLSWPALVFAAALDTSGIPAAALTSPAACAYIAGQPSTGQHSSGGGQADVALVRSAYANLERFELLSVDDRDATRTVWLHSAVRAAVRAYLAPGNVEQVVAAAAAALVEAWPSAGAPGSSPQLSAALRDSAAALRAFAGDLLWKPDAHPVLLQAGSSFMEPPAHPDSAIGYWQAFGAASSQLLGYGHAQSVLARDRLADAYAASGRLIEALPVFEATLSDREATFGPQHPETVTARLHVARSLNAAGRAPEAIALFEQVLGARERIFGPGHRETLTVRVQLAAAYEGAGRRGDSIRLYERALADGERELGPAHRDTLAARVSLAGAYLAAGQSREAITAYQRALADQEAAAGADDPGTLAVRASLAGAYRVAGKAKEAVGAYERVLADSERVLGPGDIDTLTTRCNLATAYYQAGRMTKGVKVLQRALGDCERYLGPDHPMTSTVRDNLQAATDEP
jgi:tetratricopeptide (TPR) repeat protein